MSTPRKKRHKPQTLEDFLQEQKRYWPNFSLVDGKDEDDKFQRLSAIKLSEATSQTLGEVEDVSRLRQGSLLLHLSNREQKAKLENLEELAGVPVKVTQHKNLNSCKGVRHLLLRELQKFRRRITGLVQDEKDPII